MRLCNRYQRRTCASSSASSLPPRRCIIASKKRAREVVRETGKEIDPFSVPLSLPRFRDIAIRTEVQRIVVRARRLSLINSVYAKNGTKRKSPFTRENVGN